MACGFAKPCYAAGVDRSFLPELSPPFPAEDPGAPSVWLNRIRQVTGSSYLVVSNVEGVKTLPSPIAGLAPVLHPPFQKFFRIFWAANILFEIFWCLIFSCAAIFFMVRPSTQWSQRRRRCGAVRQASRPSANRRYRRARSS